MRSRPGPQLVILTLLLFLGCDPAAEDRAAPIGAADVEAAEFAPVNRSDITGSAQLELEDDQATLAIELAGLDSGVEYPVHIHSGRCAAGGPVAIPLGRVTGGDDGAGRLTTRVAAAELAGDEPLFVQAHGPSGAAVACADLAGDDGGALTDRLSEEPAETASPADTGAGT